jgi:hypothetical protein
MNIRLRNRLLRSFFQKLTVSSIVWLAVLLLGPAGVGRAAPVYVVLWFDTEDYIEPAADDAALRIANDLTSLGVRATFKVVGEKARVLERRGRNDVIGALAKHAIGFHSNWHSVHPTPAEYLRHFGYLEGAEEFERREGPGAADVRRIFGRAPVCYGQPGSSWGPQSNLALRRMGIRVYLDEGEQVGLDEQPFWYGGLLYIFNMGRNQFRARLDAGPEDKDAAVQFTDTARRLSATGGVISIYYHPTEFIATEFWDAVNFSRGATPERSQWAKPKRRTPAESERCYGVLRRFVEHAKSVPDVRFVTADELLRLYGSAVPARTDPKAIAEHLTRGITFLDRGAATLSPADMLVQLLGLEPQVVDGPATRGATSWARDSIPRHLFDSATREAREFVRKHKRLPSDVFVGAETLSLADFTATLAQDGSSGGGDVKLARGKLAFERYFATDARKSFSWPIHPDGFSAPELLEMGRLQGWTLKPARLQPPGKKR